MTESGSEPGGPMKEGQENAVRAGQGSVPGSGRKIRLWPVLIVVGMALVILVNGLFIYIAVKGADAVVPSYNTEAR